MPYEAPPDPLIPPCQQLQLHDVRHLDCLLLRSHVQGLPVAPHTLEEENLQAQHSQERAQFLPQYGQRGPKPLELHHLCHHKSRPYR